jgi:hypothetical protein
MECKHVAEKIAGGLGICFLCYSLVLSHDHTVDHKHQAHQDFSPVQYRVVRTITAGTPSSATNVVTYSSPGQSPSQGVPDIGLVKID